MTHHRAKHDGSSRVRIVTRSFPPEAAALIVASREPVGVRLVQPKEKLDV